MPHSLFSYLRLFIFRCSISDVECFMSGKVPINPPCKEYANVLVKGLVDGNQLSYEEASAYIQEASTRPL